MSSDIKISIIIPCYNQAEFLTETLNCILSQTHHNWECIIINDGSTDDSEKIVKSFCEKDSRFVYKAKANGGLSSARNAGLELVNGEYVQFLDADDLINSEKIEMQLNDPRRGTADVLITGYTLFRDNLNKKFENYLSLKPYKLSLDGFLYEWGSNFVIPIHAGLFSYSFLVRNKIKFNESVDAREDWIFWCQLALADARFIYTEKKLSYYRVHNKSMSNNIERMQVSQVRSIFEIDDLLKDDLKKSFRLHISEILIKQFSKPFVDQGNIPLTKSLEFKIGHIILFPLFKIVRLVKKLLAYFM